MTLTPTFLFDVPQREIASRITDRIVKSTSVSVVTGFATPDGLAAIAEPIKSNPKVLKTLIVGAATYPGFGALDNLLAAGVPTDRLFVHLGHTHLTGGKKYPFARYHPMLHSKVYYMESGSWACAFVGSHNLTSFALAGLNGEAAVMVEGPIESLEFDKVRGHIAVARAQATQYSPGMKEAYAWWTREFIDGLQSEIGIPQDWNTVRTILVFASLAETLRPTPGDRLYFEIPAGIEQIESLKTEAHLFLFKRLPADARQALLTVGSAESSFTCQIVGVENKQGNKEIVADWRIDDLHAPTLERVTGQTFRPRPSAGKQQIRAEVRLPSVDAYEYRFERNKSVWDPEFSDELTLGEKEEPRGKIAVDEAPRKHTSTREWKLVKKLLRREGTNQERDQGALRLVSPESGSFILVSLRRSRRRNESGDKDR